MPTIANYSRFISSVSAARKPSIIREMTKKFEETRRGTLADLATSYGDTAPKGEIVICIGEGRQDVDPKVIEDALRAALKTQKLKDAARDVAETFGVSRRELYQLGLTFDD